MTRTMSLVLAAALLAGPSGAAAPVIVATPAEIYRAFRQDGPGSHQRFTGQTVQVTGKDFRVYHSGFAGYSGLWFYHTPPGLDVSVECDFDDTALAALDAVKPGTVVTVIGSDAQQVSTTRLRLQHCRVLSQRAPAPTPASAAPALPADPPLGEYAVYQGAGAGGFTYQYRMTLLSRTAYRLYDDGPGTYAYDPVRKRLTFKTGPLKGFGGLYYTTDRNAQGPTIALNPSGPVTNLEGSANGAYQYASFRPGGVH